MSDLGSRLAENVKRFHATTGEQTMMVAIEGEGQNISLHQIQFDSHFGLLVDGSPPSVQWYQNAEDFHPLQMPPTVLH